MKAPADFRGLPASGLPLEDLSARLERLTALIPGALPPQGELASTHPVDVLRHLAPCFCRVFAGSCEEARAIEAELALAVREVVGAPAGSGCAFTNSGSESILLALRAALAAGGRWNSEELRIVAPRTVHPAVRKAARFLNLGVILVEDAPGGPVAPGAIRKLVDSRTIMIVASAPNWSTGVVDPLTELGSIAEAFGIWYHIDACIGGFLLPFLAPPAESGWRDLSATRARSLSVDLHKFGYAPPCLSALCLADARDMKLISSRWTDWCGFPYESRAIAGDRPFGPIAGGWAVTRALGQSGYLDLARRLALLRERLGRLLVRDGCSIVSAPHSSVVCAVSQSVSPGDLVRRLASFEIRGIACDPGFVRISIDPLQEERMAATLDRYERALVALSC